MFASVLQALRAPTALAEALAQQAPKHATPADLKQAWALCCLEAATAVSAGAAKDAAAGAFEAASSEVVGETASLPGHPPGALHLCSRLRLFCAEGASSKIPNTRWSDIGGLDDVKRTVHEMVEWPRRYKHALKALGTLPPKGLLLYGPPGCSKTMIARAIASESGRSFIAVQGPELLSKWLGESEKAVRDVFKRARDNEPSILFFDELDALAMARAGSNGGAAESSATDRVLTQLLIELDNVGPASVMVVAATNRPDLIDAALLRPGRLDKLLYVPPPDASSAFAILKLALKGVPTVEGFCEEDVVQLSQECAAHNFSGAELVGLVRRASLLAIQADAAGIGRGHLVEAFAETATHVPAPSFGKPRASTMRGSTHLPLGCRPSDLRRGPSEKSPLRSL
ncbi:P-loop containing nucleoside triphosphate hydrolase protein [Pelagophyceae sp. CCMP2097]|nr:P-loop containing nucleoside triphosphate hydrolase protein [Pelagophyceae sp. CCMP2097]